MSMIDRRVLHALLERHRALLKAYLELTNHNYALVNEIKWLKEILQDYTDARENLPLSDEHVRSKVGDIQQDLQKKPTRGQHKEQRHRPEVQRHDFKHDAHHLAAHLNTMQHRCGNVAVIRHVVAKSMVQLEDDTQQLEAHLNQPNALAEHKDLLTRHQRLLAYHRQLNKEFQSTQREETELRELITQIHHVVSVEGETQVARLATLDLESVLEVMERQDVQLHASHQRSKEIVEAANVEYQKELQLHEKIEKEKQLREQQTRHPAATPRLESNLTPPQGGHDNKDK